MAPHLDIHDVRPARPTIKTEITRRATLRLSPKREIGIKIRPARRGGGRFNNQPRYDLAAYRLQAMFLEPQDYVVPPTVIRSFPLERYAEYDPEIRPTFADADSVIVVLQYWLRNISNPEDVLDADRLPCDPEYARHIGDLNIFTYIIRHLDSNRGNFLISTDADNPRVFAVPWSRRTFFQADAIALGCGKTFRGIAGTTVGVVISVRAQKPPIARQVRPAAAADDMAGDSSDDRRRRGLDRPKQLLEADARCGALLCTRAFLQVRARAERAPFVRHDDRAHVRIGVGRLDGVVQTLHEGSAEGVAVLHVDEGHRHYASRRLDPNCRHGCSW